MDPGGAPQPWGGALSFCMEARHLARHIGIVAVSPEGSALCYRKLARRAMRIADPGARPRITLHNRPFSDYLEAIYSDDWEAVGNLLLASAQSLADAGADFLILPDNVAHHAMHYVESRSPLPWVSMIDLVADAVARDKRKAVGVVGTKLVMYGSTYQSILGLKGIAVHAPQEDDAAAIDQIIFGELVHGKVTEPSRRKFHDAIERLACRGCEGVILASTEAPLLFDERGSCLPTYDPVDLLTEGVLEMATA